MSNKKTANRNILLLLLGRMTTDIGMSIQMIAMPLFIIDMGGSAATVGLYSFMSIAAVLVFPIAGVFGDRYNRKKIMVTTDFACAGVMLSLAIFAYLGLMNFPILLFSQILTSVLNGMFDPATKGMLPQFVERERLTRVNSIVFSLRTISALLGSAIGAVLYTTVGITVLFFLNGLLLCLSGCSEKFISYQHTKHNSADSTKSLWNDISGGIKYVLNNRLIWRLCVYFLVTSALIQPVFSVVLPVFFRNSLNYSDMQYGYIQMAIIIGMFLGSIFIAILFGKNRDALKPFKLGCIAITGAILIFSVLMLPQLINFIGNSTNTYFMLLTSAMCLISLSVMFVHIPIQSFIQQETPNQFMSRTFAIVGMVTRSGAPLGALIYGILLSSILPHWIMLTVSSVLVMISALFYCSLKNSKQ